MTIMIGELKLSECKKHILCVDCDDKNCLRHGDIRQDCPKYSCDRPDHKDECESCEFMIEYQKEMRKGYRKENKNEDKV